MSGIDCSCKLVVVGNYESGKSQVILFILYFYFPVPLLISFLHFILLKGHRQLNFSHVLGDK